MRDYRGMRWILAITASASEPLDPADYMDVGKVSEVAAELSRLKKDGLIASTVVVDGGRIIGGQVQGLTEEGQEFYNLLENDMAWKLVLQTLEGAGIDVSYPLLKEVCEEIVKRYVVSFIPDMPSKQSD